MVWGLVLVIMVVMLMLMMLVMFAILMLLYHDVMRTATARRQGTTTVSGLARLPCCQNIFAIFVMRWLNTFRYLWGDDYFSKYICDISDEMIISLLAQQPRSREHPQFEERTFAFEIANRKSWLCSCDSEDNYSGHSGHRWWWRWLCWWKFVSLQNGPWILF